MRITNVRPHDCILLIAFLALLSYSSFSQPKSKLPGKIEDGFVLQNDPPFSSLFILTDEKNMPDPETAEIFIASKTKVVNHKGKVILPETIRPGMEVEIKIDQSDQTKLVALQVRLKTKPDEWEEDVEGYLDRIDEDMATIDGRNVVLAPNVSLIGNGTWKGRLFKTFSEIPLGSLVELKGVRQKNGRVLVLKGEVKPNLFTPLEDNLIKTFKAGLTVPPPDKMGAGIRIGNQTFKVVEDLEVNIYVTTVGYRVVPKFLKYLPPEDPNKVVFRFYVLEDDNPNATAFSDGSVFINTGLLRRLDNEAQLAVILGHEIAHITNEHIRRRYETAQKQSLAAGLIGAAAGTVLGQQSGILVARIGYGLMSNKFSRELEDQADRVGLYYAYQAGYDVREAPAIWRKLIGIYNEGSVGNSLYSDHPSMMARLKGTRRETVLNYANADFSEAVTGRSEFLDGVGVYFGWRQPKPKPLPPAPVGKKNSGSGKVTGRNAPKSQPKPVKTKPTPNPVPVTDGFSAFFAQFKKAVLGNKRAAIAAHMSGSFEWALDGYTSRDEALNNMDSMKLWAGLRNAMLRKPVVCKQYYCNNRSGYRVWSSSRYKIEIMFEKDSAGVWHWTALLGD